MHSSTSAPAQVRPGIIVSNLRGALSDSSKSGDPSGLGTLGFLAMINGIRRRELVLVSNRHVLLAHGARRGDSIYSPVFSSRKTLTVRAETLDPIAEILDEGVEGNHPFRYPGEPIREYFIDCATARLLSGRRAADPDAIGPLAYRTARVHPLDVVGRRTVLVRKIGASGTVAGRIINATARVEVDGGPPRLNCLMIRGADAPFVQPGDSGSLVVDERNRAVGMCWGCADRDPGIAYASHIHPILDRLGITFVPGGVA